MARHYILGGLLVLSVLLAIIYFRFDPALYPFPRCPFNLLTGLYCPGCGSQRAIHALLHGQLQRAANFNLLAVVCTPILLIGLFNKIRTLLTGTVHFTSWLYRPWLTWSIMVATFSFAILRNVPGQLGNWLAP